MSSIIESIVLRLCGRYIKNFSRENIDIGVSGTVNLSNIHINTDEIQSFMLPYKPVKAFIGSIFADIPIILGGKFDIRITDIIIVCGRDMASAEELDPNKLQKVLQTWIGALYFSLASSIENTTKRNVTNQTDSVMKFLDRMLITIENIHIRIEEDFKSHVNHSISSTKIDPGITCLSCSITKIEIRNPSTKESNNSNIWKEIQHNNDSTAIKKMIKISNFVISYSNEVAIGNLPDSDITIPLIRKLFSKKAQLQMHQIVGPMSTVLKLYLAYDSNIQVFSPVKLTISLQGLDINISDEELSYVLHVITLFRQHLPVMQRKTRVLLARTADSPKLRARMRWSLIRESVRNEWWRWTSKLQDGKLRWRAWFQMWRAAARYVTLREILMYHVGFEMSCDVNNENVRYALNESLYEDHREPTDNTIPPHPTYYSRGFFSGKLIRAAETLLSQRLGTSRHLDYEDIDPLALSPVAVRAIYSLQLEMDTFLPIAVSARCRLWAEEKYRIRALNMNLSTSLDTGTIRSNNSTTTTPNPAESPPAEVVSGGVPVSGAEAATTSPPPPPSAAPVTAAPPQSTPTGAGAGVDQSYLLLGVLDISNVKPSIGMSKVDAYCSLKFRRWSGAKQLIVSEVKTVKISPESSTASLAWGEVHLIPLPATGNTLVASDSSGDPSAPPAIELSSFNPPSLLIECKDKGLFTTSIGSVSISLHQLLPELEAASPTATATSKSTSASGGASIGNGGNGDLPIIHYHLCSLSRKATSASIRSDTSRMNADDSSGINEPTLRIMSLLVRSSTTTSTTRSMAQSLSFFRTAVSEAVEVQRDIMEQRQQQRRRVKQQDTSKKEEASSNSLADTERGGGGGEDMFVLDPTMLTIQDIKIRLIIPKLSITFGSIYCSATSNPQKHPGDTSTPPPAAPLTHECLSALDSNSPPSGSTRSVSSAFVPLVKVIIRNLSTVVIGKNNPWSAQAMATISQIKVLNLRNPVHASAARKLLETIQVTAPVPVRSPLLCLPKVTGQCSISQTSSSGRFIDGRPDSSCFGDWSASFAMYPFKITLRPKYSTSTNHVSIWKSQRILQHIFASKPLWGLTPGGTCGCSQFYGSAVEEQHSHTNIENKGRLENALRNGDSYDMYPKHLNYIKEIWGIIRQQSVPTPSPPLAKPATTGSPLPDQFTTIGWMTDLRAFDVEVHLEGREDISNMLEKMKNGTGNEKDSNINDEEEDEAEADEEEWGEEFEEYDDDDFSIDDCDDDEDEEGEDGAKTETLKAPSKNSSSGLTELWRMLGGGGGSSSSDKEKEKEKADKLAAFSHRSSSTGAAAVSAVGSTVTTEEFVAMRRAWQMERERLERRVVQLEHTKSELEERIVELSSGRRAL